jgi:hypothetical protein
MLPLATVLALALVLPGRVSWRAAPARWLQALPVY